MSFGEGVTDAPNADRAHAAAERDTGGILIFVLVAVSIISLMVLPMLAYTSSVFRAGEVQSDRTQAVELANGGTWVAMANASALFDICPNDPALPAQVLPSSLPGVTTTCQLLDNAQRRPPTEVPLEVATVQVGSSVPTLIQTPQTQNINPNTASDPAAWLSTSSPVGQANTVWLPHLPVQATTIGATDLRIPAPLVDPGYASCRVFFPGTYDEAITIDEPAYFTSGVYYFTEPITLHDGADVVVGNGAELGCTNEYAAIAQLPLNDVPDPLNISGLGGTFVFGSNARITVDDAGGADIKFAINQRYVSADETSVSASADVAIISVNGMHEPFAGTEVLGQDFDLANTISVPASRVDTDFDVDGNPTVDEAATDNGYLPSVYTAKPGPPDAPTISSVTPYQVDEQPTGSEDDGILVVSWDAPNENGALIESYVVTNTNTAETCTVSVPAGSGLTLPTSCVFTDQNHQSADDQTDRPEITVVATNSYGSSVPSGQFPFDPGTNMPRVDLSQGDQAPELIRPNMATSPLTGIAYSDGLEITWDAPSDADRAPITGYSVVGKPFLDPAIVLDPLNLDPTDPLSPLNPINIVGPDIACEARFDETSCVLAVDLAEFGYDVEVFTLGEHGLSSTPVDLNVSEPLEFAIGSFSVPGPTPAPPRVPQVAGPVIVTPIVDFSTTTGTKLDVKIGGYVSVPQGRVVISAFDPSNVTVLMSGGVLAGTFDLDDPSGIPSGTPPWAGSSGSGLEVLFDNPIAQKRVRIISSVTGDAQASSDAIIQVNRSGSLAINSWVVQ